MFKIIWKFALGVARRQVESFNAVNRADKVLSYEKPKAAPHHPGTVTSIHRSPKNSSEAEPKLFEEPRELLQRLKEVKVVSTELPKEKIDNGVQQLPQSREVAEVPTYGYHDPDVIPEGKCTLREALEFISNHQSDPEKWTLHTIADKYKMDQSHVEHVTKNFRTFEIHFSEDEKKMKSAVAISTLNVLGIPNALKRPAVKNGISDISKTLKE